MKLIDDVVFTPQKLGTVITPSTADWKEVIERSEAVDHWALLRSMIIQLRFPVQSGISVSREYITALNKGVPPLDLKGIRPFDRKGIQVFLQETPAGKVPIIEARDERDFVRIYQAVVHRNEPREIPSYLGASTVFGYTNWGRIKLQRKRFREQNPTGSWSEQFDEIKKDPTLYKDNLILLSNKYYSGITPIQIGLPAEEWRRKSRIIRLHHEATHYMTKRYYGSAQNQPHDELIADYMGITAAFGHYRPEYFLLFLGLEDYPRYRKGGRLEHYLHELDLGDFSRLCRVLVEAAHQVGEISQRIGNRMECFHYLCRRPLTQIAAGRRMSS